MAKRCAKDGCPREATFGSRCALHWMRRKSILRRLFHLARWGRAEPILAQGLEQRAQIIMLGEEPGLADLSFASGLGTHSMARLREVVADADAFIRRQREESRSGSEAP